MRRKDREITDQNVIEDFIKKEQILRVAFYDEGDIYIVPVNYGYSYDESYTFYFHGAKAGRKYELAKKMPNVGFEIDGKYSLIEDSAEKIVGLNTIMNQTTSKKDWHYNNEMLEAVAIFRLDVNKLSCKAK